MRDLPGHALCSVDEHGKRAFGYTSVVLADPALFDLRRRFSERGMFGDAEVLLQLLKELRHWDKPPTQASVGTRSSVTWNRFSCFLLFLCLSFGFLFTSTRVPWVMLQPQQVSCETVPRENTNVEMFHSTNSTTH